MTTTNGTTQRWLLVIALCLAVFLPHLTSLGTILTIDEPLWQDRGVQFIKGVATGHFDQTVVANQPGITTAWLSGITSRWDSLAANQASVGFTTGILILVCTYFLIQLGGFGWGMFAGFWLALEPFGIAYSRVLHTDALFSFSCLASLLALLVAISAQARIPVRKYLIASGVLGGLALLSKSFGLILILFAVVLLIFSYRKQPRLAGLTIIWWLGSFLVTCLILWPAVWSSFSNVMDYVFYGLGSHAEGTRSGDVTEHWWYYLREIWYHTFPLTLIGTLLGLFRLFKISDTLRKPILVLTTAGAFFAIILSFSADKGERYILFTFLVLSILASYGVYWIVQKLKFPLSYVVLIFVIGWLSLNAWLIHPYYLAYASPLYFGSESHRSGWGEGLEQAAAWITQNRPGAKVITYYPRVFGYFYKGEVDTLTHLDDSNADLVVLYRSMLERAPGTPEADIVHQYLETNKQPLKTIYIQNIPYVWIFERK